MPGVDQKELREWLTFVVALGLIVYFAVAEIELTPFWYAMFGTMLGLGALVRERRPPGAPPKDPD